MRKILSALILLSLVVMPMVALAQAPVECCKMKRPVTIDTTICAADTYAGPSGSTCAISGATPTCPTEKWGLFCLINTINTVVDWIFVVLIALAAVFVILGAFNMMMAGGDPEKFSTGRSYIMYAAIGLLVAFVARIVPSIVKAVLGY